MSITRSSPFDPDSDTDCEFVYPLLNTITLTAVYDEVGVSLISIFILIYHIAFWVCGLAHSLSWDYAPGVPQREAANIRVPWREKPIGGFVWRRLQTVTRDEDEGLDSKPAGARDEENASIETVRRARHFSTHSYQVLPLSHTMTASRGHLHFLGRGWCRG